ncbi:MAG: conjugal transfer protein TrbL family protein [Candidatus Aphodocola sp.]
MSILIGWLGPLRTICMAIDGIVFSLLDNAYNIVVNLSSAEIFEHSYIESIMRSLYILFSVVAFFRLAIVLVNAIIDPEKLNEKGKGLSNIFFRVVGMIIILAVTPFVFNELYTVQKKIVSSDPNKNVIFSLFLGDKANISGYKDGEYNAGKTLQNIVLSSLITIDEKYVANEGAICKLNNDGKYEKNGNVVTDVNAECGFVPLTCVPNEYETNSDGSYKTDKNGKKIVKTCTMEGGYIYDATNCDWNNCHVAVSTYNKSYVNEDMSPDVLKTYVDISKDFKDDESGSKSDVYVYEYMFGLTSVVGVAMTWVILSFAIDIAVRMFELFILEISAPLFIATFVDPKSAQSGPFKNWISAVGKSYSSLFIKLAILAVMTLLLMVINQSDVFNNLNGDIGGLAKIIVVFGLLVFAKKAPQWIMDIIGIKGDGMGIYTPKKLKEAMLGGALAAGAAKGIAGSAYSGISNLNATAKRNRQKRKELTGHSSRRGARKALHAGQSDRDYRDSIYKANRAKGMKAVDAKAAADAALAKRNEDLKKLNSISGAKATAAQLGSLAINAAGTFNAAAKSDKLSGAFKVGNERASAFRDERALPEGVIGPGLRKIASNFNDTAWGNSNDIYESRRKLQDQENARIHSGGRYTDGLGEGMIVEGNGDAVKLFKKYGAVASGEELLSQYCETKGISVGDFNKIKATLKEDGDTGMFSVTIDGKNVNINKELYASGTGGAENLQKMFNTYQTNALANSAHSQEQYMQQANTYQSMVNTMNNTAQSAQVLATALAASLPTALKGISIDTSSMTGIQESIENLNNNLYKLKGDEQKVLKQKLDELQEITKQHSYIQTQTKGIEKSMEPLKSTIEELRSVVDGIEGRTITEKEQNLAKKSSKLEKVIAGLKQNNGDKKE